MNLYERKGFFMKLLSNKRNTIRKNMLKNKRGQGATEYILLLVVIVGLVITFGPKIKSAMEKKVGNLESSMDEVQAK